MPLLSCDPRAYIRPSPSRGDLGGVAASSPDTIKLCECTQICVLFHSSYILDAGFDVVLVESVGVGQSELSLADLVDIYVLLVAPGAGDELQVEKCNILIIYLPFDQGIKKGITEMTDMILVNKCDPPITRDARLTLSEYKSAMKFRQPLYHELHESAPVLPVSARAGHGIAEAWNAISTLHSKLHVHQGSNERFLCFVGSGSTGEEKKLAAAGMDKDIRPSPAQPAVGHVVMHPF